MKHFKIRGLPLAILVISAFFSAMITARAETGDAALDTMVAELETLEAGSEAALALRSDIIGYVAALPAAPDPGSEFRRFMVRGEMAGEMTGHVAAATEYRAAALIAPWRADAYFRLGRAEEKAGNPAGAAKAFQMYLKAAPNAADFSQVEEKVFRLEYQAEVGAGRSIPRQADAPPASKPAFPTPSRQELLFYKRAEGTPEPRNMDSIADSFPTISSFAKSGKVLVVFDIGEDGRTSNFRLLAATRGDFDDEAKMVVKKMRFAKKAPYRDVVYDLTFCKRTDRIRKLVCDIRFEDMGSGGEKAPKLTSYTVPNYNTTAVQKGKCGAVVIKFNVTSDGNVTNSEITSAEGAGGQFGYNAKEAVDIFRFEKGWPVEGMAYKISFGLPGTCEAP